MKKIILLSILAVLCISSYGQNISWRTIETPAPDPVPVIESETEMGSESGFEPGAEGDRDSVDVMTELSREEIEAYEARYEEVMSRRYPPAVELTLTLPRGRATAASSVIEAGFDDEAMFLYEEGHVYLQAELPFATEEIGTYAIQLVPLVESTPRSTVREAQADVNDDYAVTATPNEAGMLIFDITEIVDAVHSRTVSNRVLLRPMTNYDRFEMPDARGVSPFELKYAYGE